MSLSERPILASRKSQSPTPSQPPPEWRHSLATRRGPSFVGIEAVPHRSRRRYRVEDSAEPSGALRGLMPPTLPRGDPVLALPPVPRLGWRLARFSIKTYDVAPSPTAYPYSAILGSSPLSFAQASLLGRLSSVAARAAIQNGNSSATPTTRL